MTHASRVDVVLPCLDEAAALPWVLERIAALGQDYRAVVVDNGSTDGSPEIAERLGATVVREGVRGYGAACHAGLLAATADVVAFCDCDASIDPGVLAGMVALLDTGGGRADMVVGQRRPTARGAWPLHARLANRYLAGMVSRSTGVQLRDLGPVRVTHREALLALGVADRRSGYPLETILLAARAGWDVVGVDVAYLPRAGRSKVTGTLRGTVQAVADMRRVLATGVA